MELIHDISEVFLTYDDRQDIIIAHQCLIDFIELYSDHIAVHLNALKERLLKDYQKRYKLEEMPTARVTRPQATDTSSLPLIAPPNVSESFGERSWHLFDERAAAAALRVNNPIDVATEPAPRGQPPRTDTSTDAVLYHTLKTNLEVIFVSDWGEFASVT